MKAVVLAGGKGTRLAPFTTVIPKPLMPIGDMPILEVMLRQMKRAGVDEVVLAIGHLGQLLRAFFGDGSKYGLRISYSIEERPLGTAGPLALIDGLDEPFLVVNGDTLTMLDLAEFSAFHHRSGAIATIALSQRLMNIDLGVVQVNEDGAVVGYVEKPKYEFQASMGIYLFEPRALKYIPRGEYFDFPTLVLRLLEAGEDVAGYRFEGYWKDLGRPEDYEQAVADFERMREDFLGVPETMKV
jgi:NDP-sugar pyrophosphorylase family protein